MRTKQLLNLHKELSELNCHYSHYLFISEQFSKENSELIKRNGEQFVETVYKENIFASQFNVRLNELPQEIEKTKQFIIRSFYLLSFSNFEIFCRDIYHFIAQFKKLAELHTKYSPINQIIENLSLKDDFSKEEINTLIYLKLRRNALIHRDSKRAAQGELIKHIKATGKDLNKFWRKQKVKITDLDFSRRNNFFYCSEKTAIELINIIRRLAEKLDFTIIQKIDENKLLELIVNDFKSTYSDSVKGNNLIKKFNHFALIEYGAKIDKQKINSFLGE